MMAWPLVDPVITIVHLPKKRVQGFGGWKTTEPVPPCDQFTVPVGE